MKIFASALVLASVISALPKSQPMLELKPLDPIVLLLHEGEVYPISAEEYVCGVVASEMPYTFHSEALKAQAVAARTYLYYLMDCTVGRHEEADICSDASHCCGYVTEGMLALRYGEKYAAEAMSAAYTAAYETYSEILTYEDVPILSVWHSSSDGATESCEAVWTNSLPYLMSVSSPEEARTEVVSFGEDEALALLTSNGFDCGNISGISITRTASGRCASLNIGNVTLTGSEVRRVFGLKSTDITIFFVGGRLIFFVCGYGHGVGMSQYGADAMARSGLSYQEILAHYYSSAVLTYS